MYSYVRVNIQSKTVRLNVLIFIKMFQKCSNDTIGKHEILILYYILYLGSYIIYIIYRRKYNEILSIIVIMLTELFCVYLRFCWRDF